MTRPPDQERSRRIAKWQRQKRLLDHADFGRPLTYEDLALLPGFHFCPDWDRLPICEDSPEWETCTCEKENLR